MVDGAPEPGPRGHPRAGLAILGGTFDPPHTSHLRLAREAWHQLPVAAVHVVPAGDHPHKRGRGASAANRLAMCRLAFAGEPHVVVDDRELRRAGPSFTVDTLDAFAREFPGRPLYFLIGSDNLPLLPTWRDHHRLLQLATVVTWPRRGHPTTAAALAGIDLTEAERDRLLAHVLEMPADAVASSDLRRRWREGERDLPEVPEPVRHWIEAHRLYESP